MRWLVARVSARPLLVVALLAVVVGAINVWWVANHRDLGAYSSDEANYLSKAFLYRQGLVDGSPGEFLGQVFEPSHTGVLVPLASVAAMLAGGPSVTVAMAIQALIVGLAAVAAAGIANRLAGPWPALVAGVVVLCLPASVNSARSYQFGMALAASTLLALWALLASERGHRTWPMLGFGAAVGAMLLSRTMALGLIPAVALGALVIVRHDRRSWRNLGLAALVALIVAGPWWYRSRGPVFDYLLGFGYGDQASDYGPTGLVGRLIIRPLAALGDLRMSFTVLSITAVVVAGVHLVRWRRSGRSLRSWPGASRGLAALAAIVIVGYAALLATANQGVWFELPLELLAVTGLVALVASLGGRFARGAAIVALALSAITVVVSVRDDGGAIQLDQPDDFALAYFSGGLIDRTGFLGEADGRFYEGDRAQRAEAARAWWAVNEELAAMVEEHRRTTPALVTTVSGNSHLLNDHTLRLAQATGGLDPPPGEVPDTRLSDEQLLTSVEPRRGGDTRLLILMEPRSEPFHADREVARLRSLAEGAGWEVDGSLALPDGGRVDLLVHRGR